MTTSIRPALKADHPAIMLVWEQSVRATHDFLTEADISYIGKLVEEQFLDAVTLYVAESNSVVAGFLGLSEDKIEMLFIAPEHMGHSIGRKLVEFAKTTHNIHLVDVNEQNPQAIGFYEKLGFKTIGRSERDGLGKPFPLLHMKRSM